MKIFWIGIVGLLILGNNGKAQDTIATKNSHHKLIIESKDSTSFINEIKIHRIFNENSLINNTFIEYSYYGDTCKLLAIHDSTLYANKWDSLPQPIFWRQLMQLPPDTAIVSIAENREILEGMYSADYDSLNNDNKIEFKDSLCKKHNLEEGTKLYVTFGRSDFYRVSEVIHQIDTAIRVFTEVGTDPFYAQAILLIESPNRLEYSWAGAYGPFQLMKSIGLKYGLKITKDVDERADLQKAAKVTAKFFKEFCIPQVKGILKQKNIKFKETDLWFRLLVLHVYHAGWGNVKGVLNTINPDKGGQALITTIWQTTYGSFKNASQNYSQVALAAMMELDQLILESKPFIYFEF